MAAFPMGGHPTFGAYIEWARQQGCEIRNGVVLDEQQRPHSITQIIAPGKKSWVTEVGTQHKDHLVPTTIARFDRRLGLKSPYFSIDAPELDED